MRYSASDKTEIIRLVEQSSWPARRTGKARHSQIVVLPVVGSLSARRTRGPRGSPLTARSDLEPDPGGYPLSDCRPGAGSTRTQSSGTSGALHGRGKYFVSEASVYRLLKAHDLITSPAYIVIKAAEEFKDKTTAPTSSGRLTSPISRSRAGAGAISPPCSTTSRASLSPGSSARL